MNQRDSVTIRFEGDSGDGILSMGKIAARAAARLGYHVYTYSTFLAVVRGGQVTFQLRVGASPLLSQGDEPDILVALNRQALVDHGPRVQPGGLILHSPSDGDSAYVPAGVHAVAIPFAERAVDETGSARSKNMVASGAFLGLMNWPGEIASGAVRDMFKGKGEEVAEQNIRAMEAGIEEGRRHQAQAEAFRFEPLDPHPRLLLSGNEAVALGALAAGVRFYAGYPITPASEIMEWLAAHLPSVGGMMVQAEDEIASLGMCIGASFGGVKSMTATSGPGLSLMIELLGLAGMAEIPVVVVDVQRAGPSTGMPTKEAQGDLNLAVHGTHGEVPRVVLAPQTVADCFDQTVRAVNIAHQFHIPVLLLSSQSLSHRQQTIDPPSLDQMPLYKETFWQMGDEMSPMKGGAEGQSALGEDHVSPMLFERFRLMPDGRPSPRSLPGTEGGMYRAGGLEHDEFGQPNFEPDVRTRMVERRRARMHAIEREFSETVVQNACKLKSSPLGVISWGATASIVHEVVEQLEREKELSFSCLFPRILWPLPDGAFRRFLTSGVKTLFVCELNATRQLAEMLRSRYTAELLSQGIHMVSITKDDGLPFAPGEIRERILGALHSDGSATSEVI